MTGMLARRFWHPEMDGIESLPPFFVCETTQDHNGNGVRAIWKLDTIVDQSLVTVEDPSWLVEEWSNFHFLNSIDMGVSQK